jgi:hypothetical protein
MSNIALKIEHNGRFHTIIADPDAETRVVVAAEGGGIQGIQGEPGPGTPNPSTGNPGDVLVINELGTNYQFVPFPEGPTDIVSSTSIGTIQATQGITPPPPPNDGKVHLWIDLGAP